MITSHSNPFVKRIKRLRQKKYRWQEQAYFIEGIRVVLSAIESRAPVEVVIFSSELLTSEPAWEMLARCQVIGIRCEEVSAAVFAGLSDRENPVGLAAIVNIRWLNLADLSVSGKDLFVALVDVAEPGNLGTIIRTLDAVGAAGLILVGSTVDPFHPSAVKASMGSLYSVAISQAEDWTTLFNWARTLGLHTVATTAKAQRSYWSTTYPKPALLVMGSERQGLPPEILTACDQTVTIPMQGAATSLNLAVATGVMLYEIARQQQGEN